MYADVDRNDRSMGIIEFSSMPDAEDAMRRLSGVDINNTPVRLEFADVGHRVNPTDSRGIMRRDAMRPDTTMAKLGMMRLMAVTMTVHLPLATMATIATVVLLLLLMEATGDTANAALLVVTMQWVERMTGTRPVMMTGRISLETVHTS